MASGARPSSNQRSTLDANTPGGGGGKMVTSRGHRHALESESQPIGSDFLTKCVVCGDRACSHYYYGVAACHGCKCFFWRSVKQQAQYICRYNKKCDITVSARNVCRYCRFRRCLAAGMQPESVRLAKNDKRVDKVKKDLVEKTCNGFSDSGYASPKVSPISNNSQTLLAKIVQLESRISEEADFNENQQTQLLGSLQEVVSFPECLDAYRTRVTYCIRLRNVTEEEMNFCKFRTLTYSLDYIRNLRNLHPEHLCLADQIALIRSCYCALSIFCITVGTIETTNVDTLLCLPTGITVSTEENFISNSFMSQAVVVNIINNLLKPVRSLKLSNEEINFLKAIIVVNSEAVGLTLNGQRVVGDIQDQLHAALYEHYESTMDASSAPLRFAKILHLLPKILLLSRDLIEHIRMEHTFNVETRRVDPLFYELFGDIFHEPSDTTSLPQPYSNISSGDQEASPPFYGWTPS